jgi:hypothetical protein
MVATGRRWAWLYPRVLGGLAAKPKLPNYNLTTATIYSSFFHPQDVLAAAMNQGDIK